MSTKLKYGPNTAEVQAMLDRLRQATPEELEKLHVVRRVVGVAKRVSAKQTSWNAAESAGRKVAWDAAWAALNGVAFGDLLEPEMVSHLIQPWVSVFGPVGLAVR